MRGGINMENNDSFPIPTAVPGNGWLTLRDYFAGQALASIAAVPLNLCSGIYGVNSLEHYIAKDCYRIADAMLEARKEK
jgi:hypothetical protein